MEAQLGLVIKRQLFAQPVFAQPGWLGGISKTSHYVANPSPAGRKWRISRHSTPLAFPAETPEEVYGLAGATAKIPGWATKKGGKMLGEQRKSRQKVRCVLAAAPAGSHGAGRGDATAACRSCRVGSASAAARSSRLGGSAKGARVRGQQLLRFSSCRPPWSGVACASGLERRPLLGGGREPGRSTRGSLGAAWKPCGPFCLSWSSCSP